MSDPLIVIAPYDDRWPDEFATLGSALRQELGTLAVRIDHIGSTSVPGLAAKDRIDIQVTVAELDMSLVRQAVEAAGFVWVEHLVADHPPPGLELQPADLAKFVATSGPGHRPANCHLREVGRYNQRYPLLSRDYLRASPDAAATYEEIKRTLAAWYPDDSASYYAVKDPVFDLIMQSAELWASATGWEPGPSDA